MFHPAFVPTIQPMHRATLFLLAPLAALLALALWKGPQSPAFKPGGPSHSVRRPYKHTS